MKYFFLYIVFLSLFTACKQEKMEIPDTGRKVVINGLITTDSRFNVRISGSSLLTDQLSTSTSSATNVNVGIYQNNTFIDSLYLFPHDTDNELIGLGNYWSKSVVPIVGKEYKIVAKISGFPEATASTTIPDMVRIERVDTSRITVPLTDHNPYGIKIVCNIEFDDPANENNYYMLFIDRIPNPYLTTKMNFDSQDPIIEEKMSDANGVMAIAFTDKIINGKKHRLAVNFDCMSLGYPYWDDRGTVDGIPNPISIKTFYFRLYSITGDFFKYIHTLNLYNKNFGNPLTDPVIVYSNVTGGYGIFSGASVSSDSIVYDYAKQMK